MNPELEPNPASRRAILFLCLLVLGVGAAHVAWLSADVRIPFWDQYRYHSMTRSAHRLIDDGRWTDLLDVHPSHPPLYSILGTLPGLALGEGFASARFLNVVLFGLSAFLVYALGRRWLSQEGACWAAAFSSVAPLSFSLTHLYYIENLLTPVALLGYLLLLLTNDFRRPLAAMALGVVAGVGCLVKWTYPVFLAGPILWALVRGRNVRSLPVMLLVSGGLLVAGAWYWHHHGSILEFLRTGVSGGFGHLSAVTGLEGAIYYPKKIVLVGVGVPLALAAAVGFVILWTRQRALAISVASAILVPMIVFALLLTKKPRHLLPLVPLLALLAATAVMASNARIRAILGSLLLLHLGLATAHASFFGTSEGPKLLGVPLLTFPHPPGPPDTVRWPHAEVIEWLTHQTARPLPLDCRVNFNLPTFRQVGFQDLAEAARVALVFEHCPLYLPGEGGSEPTFPLEFQASADLTLVKTGTNWVRSQGGHPIHLFSARVSEELQDPGSALAKAHDAAWELPLPNGSLLLLLWPRDVESVRQTYARWVLRFEPEHQEAQRVLGIASTQGAALEFLRVHGLAFIESLEALDAERRGDAQGAARAWASAVARHPEREEHWSGLLRCGDASQKNYARNVLRVWTEYRLADAAKAAYALATMLPEPRPLGWSLRWWRRCLESGPGFEIKVRAGLEALGQEPPNDPAALLPWLRSHEQRHLHP